MEITPVHEENKSDLETEQRSASEAVSAEACSPEEPAEKIEKMPPMGSIKIPEQIRGKVVQRRGLSALIYRIKRIIREKMGD